MRKLQKMKKVLKSSKKVSFHLIDEGVVSDMVSTILNGAFSIQEHFMDLEKIGDYCRNRDRKSINVIYFFFKVCVLI